MMNSFMRMAAAAISIFSLSFFVAEKHTKADAGQRGFHVLAGGDRSDRGLRHRRGNTIVIVQPQKNDADDDIYPIDIKPLNPVSRVIHVTEEQDRLARQRAANRGGESGKLISVIAGDEAKLEVPAPVDHFDSSVNEDSPQVIYFND